MGCLASSSMSQPWIPSDWKLGLSRAVAGSIGSGTALVLTGPPENPGKALVVGLLGLVIGLLLAFGLEYVLRLHGEVERLQAVESELVAEKEARGRERDLLRHELAVARRALVISEVSVGVWGGAFSEAAAGHVLPLDAILARIGAEQKAKGLDIPLPPPSP